MPSTEYQTNLCWEHIITGLLHNILCHPICHGIQMYPVPPSVLSQPRWVRVLKYNVGRPSFHLCLIKWLSAVLCFLSSPLCLISHLAFPLCAALVIVFLWSALAFDIQTPKTLAALQINCLSQQYDLPVPLCLFLSSRLVSLIDLKQVMDLRDHWLSLA